MFFLATCPVFFSSSRGCATAFNFITSSSITALWVSMTTRGHVLQVLGHKPSRKSMLIAGNMASKSSQLLPGCFNTSWGVAKGGTEGNCHLHTSVFLGVAEGTEGLLTSTPLLSLFLDSVRGSVTVRHPDLAMSYDWLENT